MARIRRWVTTGIGRWEYPRGILGIAVRVPVIVVLAYAAVVVVLGVLSIVAGVAAGLYLLIRSAIA